MSNRASDRCAGLPLDRLHDGGEGEDAPAARGVFEISEDVIVVIARRQGFGKAILLADVDEGLPKRAADALEATGHAVSTQVVDVSSGASVRSLADAAAALGDVVQVVDAAGLSPNLTPVDRILAVDLHGSRATAS